ncbi:hypothetical protein Dcar01_01439 [Deinococcus carri]|uniref:Uncharacterized protein n=1 Tax=Deinococcus carri TaxID=1211323 RepID=A0ABP9W844_9DEIO
MNLRSLVTLLLLGGSVAGSSVAHAATLQTPVEVQVQGVCEVAALQPGALTLRCTAGTVPPTEPRLLPELPAQVRALGPLVLRSVMQEASGAELLRYEAAPTAPTGAALQVVWFD